MGSILPEHPRFSQGEDQKTYLFEASKSVPTFGKEIIPTHVKRSEKNLCIVQFSNLNGCIGYNPLVQL